MEPANLLKIESLDDGWCDKDVVMLHACFQLLENCVKEENLFDGHTDWEQSYEFKRARVQLQGLYEWWQTRKERAAENTFNELNRANYEEDTRRLKELIEWRHMLWT